MKKYLALLHAYLFIVFFGWVGVCPAQLPSGNMAKYWYYRNRLDFFVVPGSKAGESQIACVRNKLFEANNSRNLDYGQHGIYTGFYWGVLATEYYLLKQYGQHQSALQTEWELYNALNAYVQQMDMCEHYWGLNNSFDGFFIRENMPCNFLHPTADEGKTIWGERHLDLMNKRVSSGMQYNETDHSFYGLPRGHPGYIDHRTTCDGTEGGTPMGPPDHDHPEVMSQDETIGLFIGLSLTIKLTGGSSCQSLARDIADKLVRYVLNLDKINGPADNRIFEADGSMVAESRGGNTYYLAKGFIMAGEAMTGETDYGGVDFVQNTAWSANSWWAWDHGLSMMAGTLAAIGDSWTWTDEGLMNITAHYNWETYYILLWEVLHNKCMSNSEQTDLLNKARHQLNNGPCEGPYSYVPEYDYGGNPSGLTPVHSGGGWASTYKWCKEQIYQDGGDWYLGNYNGLDYMILYNLYHIIQLGSTDVPAYISYKDLIVSGSMPHCIPMNNGSPFFENGVSYSSIFGSDALPATYVGFNSINSSQVIGLESSPAVFPAPGNVTYKSEMKISLKPGFHAKSGTYFHALLEDIDCENNTYKNSSEYPDRMNPDPLLQLNAAQARPYLLIENAGNFNAADAHCEACAGLADEEAVLSCFPNPFDDQLHISFVRNEGDEIELSIWSSAGKNLYTFPDISNETGMIRMSYNGSGLPAGTYFIIFRKNLKNQVLAIIKY